jgi:hypothetical protein
MSTSLGDWPAKTTSGVGALEEAHRLHLHSNGRAVLEKVNRGLRTIGIPKLHPFLIELGRMKGSHFLIVAFRQGIEVALAKRDVMSEEVAANELLRRSVRLVFGHDIHYACGVVHTDDERLHRLQRHHSEQRCYRRLGYGVNIINPELADNGSAV